MDNGYFGRMYEQKDSFALLCLFFSSWLEAYLGWMIS